MKFLALIPARKESKGIKNKNFKKFNSKPLIWWTIKSSKKSISGDDNLYSFFNLECMQNGVRIIYNYKLNFQSEKRFKKYFIPYNFNS